MRFSGSFSDIGTETTPGFTEDDLVAFAVKPFDFRYQNPICCPQFQSNLKSGRKVRPRVPKKNGS